MDPKNRIHTDASFTLVRAEALLVLAGLCYLLWAFSHEVRWGRFIAAFALIDVVGYLPGAIAFRRAARHAGPGPVRIDPIYHHLYNVTHSFLTVAAALAVWLLLWGDLEWAMLAPLIHLLGDRGLFGNTYKPTVLPFEPTASEVAPLLRQATLGGGSR